MRNLCKVFILLLSAFSCSKTSDPAPASVLTCMLTKMVTVQSGSTGSVTVTQTFDYDASNRLAKVTGVYEYAATKTIIDTFSYSGGMVTGVTSEESYAGSSGTNSNQYFWTNQNQGVTQILDQGIPNTFTYDANGNLKTFFYSYPGQTQTVEYSYGSDLETVNTTTSNAGGTVKGTTKFGSHDGKKNPYSLLATAMNQPFYIQNGVLVNTAALHKSNPLTETNTTLTTSPPLVVNKTYTYEYNAKGYPTRITAVNSLVDGTSVTTLTYKNCD